MLLPAVQYGDWNTVKKRMRKIVAQLKRGDDLHDVMTHDEMLDTSAHPGMLVLSGIMAGSTPNFHCFMPWKSAWDALFDLRATPTAPAPIEDAIFESSLRAPWESSGAWHRRASRGCFPPCDTNRSCTPC